VKPEVLKEIIKFEDAEDYDNLSYMELIVNNYYTKHVIRLPV